MASPGATVFAAIFGRTREIDMAITEVREITQAVQTWDDDWLRTYLEDKVKQAGAQGQSEKLLPNQIKIGDSADIFVDVCADDWALSKPGPLVGFMWAQRKPEPLVDFKPYQVGPDDALKLARRFTNLGFFKEYWSGLYETTQAWVPESLAEKALVQSADGEKWEVVDWSNNEKQGRFGGVLEIRHLNCGNPSTIKVIEDSFAKKDPLHFSQCAYEGSISEAIGTRRPPPHVSGFCRKIQLPSNVKLDLIGHVILPVSDFRRIPIRPQQNLREHLASKNLKVSWPFGSFEYTFPELNRLTADYQDLSLDKIQAILRTQKLTSVESIEVIGIKLAVEAVRSGGALLILGVQLYFLLHLREFVRRISPESEAREAAWIGLYPGTLAVAAFWFSAFILPSIAVLVLFLPMLDPAVTKWMFSLYSSLLMISILISYSSWLVARRLAEKRLAPRPDVTLVYEDD
jgi:hypothetical protein